MIRFRTFLAIVTVFGLIVFLISLVSRGPQQNFERTDLPSVSRSDAEVPKSSPDVAATDTDEITPKVQPEMAVTNTESDKISRLMERAREQAAGWYLTTPAGNNALETYQEILTLEPDYKPALEGIKDLGVKYTLLGAIAKQRGELARAERYLLKAIELAPDHPAVQSLQRALEGTEIP